ncbi:MAG: hypothetical protein ACRDSR_06240 [Pseudonocardiaceae bacterium]
MQYDDPQHANRPQWRQMDIRFDGHASSERNAIAHLDPALMTTESTGLLTSWFFMLNREGIRAGPGFRSPPELR